MRSVAVILLSFLFFAACSDDGISIPEQQSEVRTIAYNSLSDVEKASISDDWHNSAVIEGKYLSKGDFNVFVFDSEIEAYFYLSDLTVDLYSGKKLSAVRFNTVDDALLGPITVIVDLSDKKAIGQFLRL